MNPTLYKKLGVYFLISIFPFFIYFLTHPSVAGLIDSGLMAAASSDLGIALPTGFPVYTIISHIISLIPLGTITDRLYLTSYLSSSLILLVLYFIYKEFGRTGKKLYAETATLVACISLAFSYQFWASSINIETFTITNLAIFVIFYLLLKINSSLSENNKHLKRYIYLLFIAFGLSLGLSPTVSTLTLPILVFIFFNRGKLKKDLKHYALGIVISITIFLVEYGFLLIRASSHPFLNFGEPTSIHGLVNLMTGRGFISNPSKISESVISVSGFYFDSSVVFQSFSNYLRMFLYQFNPLFIPIGIYGLYKIYSNKFLFWTIVALFFSNMFFAVFYISGNQENWALSSWILFSIFIFFGLYYLLEKLDKINKFHEFAYKRIFIFYFIFLIIAFLPLIFWYGKLNRHDMTFTKDYIENLYKNVQQNSVVIGGGNVFEGQTAYTREVLKYRQDIIPVAGNLFYDFEWYRDNISKSTDIIVSQKTKDTVINSAKNNQSKIILSLINDNPSRNFYLVTSYVRSYMLDVNTSCSKGLCRLGNYILIPHGLVYKIIPEISKETANEKTVNFNFSNGLPDKYYFLEQLAKMQEDLMIEEYQEGYINMGDYYLNQRKPDKALSFYKNANNLNSKNNTEPVIRLAIAYQNLNNLDLAKMYYEESLKLLPDNQELRGNYETFMKQNEKYFQQSTQYTQQTATSSNASYKKYVSLSGYSFNYLSDWKIETVKNQTVIKDPANSFTVQIQLNSLSNQNFDGYLKDRTDTYGTLIQEGKALIPNFDIGFVRIWNEGGIKKDQFFLVKGDKLIEIMVYPSDSQLMKQFDQIVTSLKLGS